MSKGARKEEWLGTMSVEGSQDAAQGAEWQVNE